MSENEVKRSYLRVEICDSKYNPNLLTKWSGRSCLMKWQGNVFSPATSAYTGSIGSSVARLSGVKGQTAPALGEPSENTLLCMQSIMCYTLHYNGEYYLRWW